MNRIEERFAFVLEQLPRAGLLVLVVTFAIFAFGLREPSFPLSNLPEAWTRPAAELLALRGVAPGWDWVRQLDRSDLLCLIGPVLFGVTVIAAYAALLPLLFHRGTRRYLAIVLVELVLLIVAMSGYVGVEG